MTKIKHALRIVCALGLIPLAWAGTITKVLPPPVITMTGVSKPLVPPPAASASSGSAKLKRDPMASGAAATPSVNMKILVLAGDVSEYSYQSITAYLTQIGVPYTGIGVDTLTPDASGDRLSNLALTDPVTGRGLYQGFIYTNSSFGVCNPTCVNLLTNADFTTLGNYISKFNIRVVTYYTYPEAKWGLTLVGSGASYTASSPLQVSLTAAGASIFSYINSANPIPVAGSGTGGIYAYEATPTAAAGETTTPILTAGSYVVGVTHTNAAGQQSLSLTMDNFPTLLHSLAFSYGVINWVTNGVFLGQRQIYLNSPQIDDILFGDRLYAPTLPQCPNDPSCPDILGTSSDMQALANWESTKHQDKQFPYLRASYAYVGVGSTPGFAPVPDTVPPAMTALAADFGWVSHTWTHGNLDCYSLSATGACVPATLDQSLFEIETNAAYAQSLGIPNDTTGIVTPFNGGLDNLAFFQAAAQEGITSVISPNAPPGPGLGSPSLVPSILLMPRNVTNLFDDVDSPSTGVYGSWPDEYNALYGPAGTTPAFTANQTYSQILDNESTMLLQLRMLAYQPFPLGFHMSNSIAYDNVHSLLSDLLDATIKKYEQLYTLPVTTLDTMRDIAPLLLNRASYNASGVTGVYTPGVSVVLTTTGAGVIPVTGACSQATCPTYGGQLQDSVSMAANSTITLSLNASAGVGLSTVTVNPATVNSLSPSQGLVSLNGPASSSVVVSLSSSSPLATVPASVTIAPGDSGAAFTVTTKTAASPTSVVITATYGKIVKTAQLTLEPATGLAGISLSSASVAAGSSPTATISLNGAAPAGGIVVSLLSSNLAATVPAGVTISAGASSATFSISTLAVGASTSGNILAIYNGVTTTAPLTVTPGIALALTGVSLTPTAVIGGNVSTGTVTLNGLAPAAGTSVALSSNLSGVTVQSPVFVNAGSTTATFTVTTTSVTAIGKATISATLNGVTATAVLTVAPVFELAGVSLTPAIVFGGTPSEGTVTLSGPAPAAGAVVSLTSNSAVAVVPASVTVTSGNFTATFPVTTTAVASSTNATIGATYAGVTVSSTLTVTSAAVLSGVSLNPASVTGGTPSTGTVTLTSPAPAAGAVVTLSSNSAAAVVPATVTISAGSSSANFAVATTTVTASVTATISSTYAGVVKTASLTVTPAVTCPITPYIQVNGAAWQQISSVTVAYGSVVNLGPQPLTGTWSWTGPNGFTSTAREIDGIPLTTGANTFIASYTSTTSCKNTQTFVITSTAPPVAISGVSVNPGSVTGGTSSTGTVTLNEAAPSGGVVVSLSSNNGAAVVPATVTVNASGTTATFAIATKAVSASSSATIGATYSGVTKTASLTVTPLVVSALSLNPSSIAGGNSSTGTVTLSGPAPAGGVLVYLSTDLPIFTYVPLTVTVPAGSSTVSFTVSTTPLLFTCTVNITASSGGVSKSAVLTVGGLLF